MMKANFIFLALITYTIPTIGQEIFIHPNGNDNASGLKADEPKRSITAAIEVIEEIRNSTTEQSKVILLDGEYYLNEPIQIDPDTRPFSLIAHNTGEVIIKGSKIIKGIWEKYNANIMQLRTGIEISPYAQLYVNGTEMVLARYPNYDSTASHYNGYAADAIDPERVKQWKHPEGAILHAMHRGEWGGFHYVVESVDKKGKVTLKGGHQNNRPSPMHEDYRMVENVFEELDAPGEWYYNPISSTLYLYPYYGTDLQNSVVEISTLKHLIEIKGSKENPIKSISLQGIRFEHTNRTFMEEYEPLLRSDWMIYRGAAIFLENTEDCQIRDCEFTGLGGNVIFASGYNRDLKVVGNHIYNCGASAISFVGLPEAVRSPSYNYQEFVEFEDLDMTSGPKIEDYPANCLVDNNLIHDIGKVEKQVAGVQISMAMNITVRHNSIYDVPRAGINVSEGTWGGHIIEYNDVFNTVLASSDHGAFNSWGRDRFWHPDRKTMDQIMKDNPMMPYLDAIETTVIRNNRMRCDHGWDIDLDDGSSNYHLYNNLCLNGGIKLREGFYRIVENNIMLNNGFHPHVWFLNSGDVFVRNIVMTDHKDIRLQGWGKEIDYNLFPDKTALAKAQSNGTDQHSDFGDPLFLDPEQADFRVSENSPAIQLGFKNFSMDQFGVQKPELKKKARTPEIPELLIAHEGSEQIAAMTWLGATIKNIENMGERSAAGLKDDNGVLIKALPAGCIAEKGGLEEGDVIVSCEDNIIANTSDLISCFQGNNWKGILNLKVIRNQKEVMVLLKTK
ncbi:MAG: PDZ domain-containing protein [Cyclobacteriaceae bacterium]|jgi:hypothetical protein